jgi:hypothetical protein
MPENISGVPLGRSVFHLTSPFIGQKAIEAGRAVNLDHLNDLYPSLGDKFSSQFLDSLILFVHSCNIQANSESIAREELSRSILLSSEWADWYEPLHSIIDAAIRSSVNSPTHQ